MVNLIANKLVTFYLSLIVNMITCQLSLTSSLLLPGITFSLTDQTSAPVSSSLADETVNESLINLTNPLKCNYTLTWYHSSNNLTILSPNYYANYHQQPIDCKLKIFGLPGYRWLIKLIPNSDLTDFNDYTDCDKDYLEIVSETSTNIDLCNSDQLVSETLTSTENVTIRFHLSSTSTLPSSSSVNNGFKLVAMLTGKCPRLVLYAPSNGGKAIFCSGNHEVEYWDESCSILINPPKSANGSESFTFDLTFLTVSLGSLGLVDDDNDDDDDNLDSKKICNGNPYLIAISNSSSSSNVICDGQLQNLKLVGPFVSLQVILRSTLGHRPMLSSSKNADPEFCFEYSVSPTDSWLDELSASSSPCPSSDWFHLDSHCYKLFTDPLVTWTEAETICSSPSINGHLVSITNDNVQKLIEKLISRDFKRSHGRDGDDNSSSDDDNWSERTDRLSVLNEKQYFYWIGATDVKHENNFQWSDGQAFSFTNWFTGWQKTGTGNNGKYGKQPSDDGFSDQDCVELRNKFKYASKGSGSTGDHFYWNDISCDAKNAFICQVDIKEQEYIDSVSQYDDKKKKEPCGKRILLSIQHSWEVFTTPRYPEPYPNNLNCTFLISSNDEYLVELVFTDFILEEGDSNCQYDFVEIRSYFSSSSDYSSLLSSSSLSSRSDENLLSVSRYCGDFNAKIKLLRTVGRHIVVDMVTDESHNYRGFRAEVRLLPNSIGNLIVSPSVHSHPETIDLPTTLCDDKMFTAFEGDCYLVSSYPEVSWTTARQICSDINAEILVIRDYDDEKRILDFFTATNLDRFSSDLSRPVRAFWILQPKSSVFATQEILPNFEDDDGARKPKYGDETRPVLTPASPSSLSINSWSSGKAGTSRQGSLMSVESSSSAVTGNNPEASDESGTDKMCNIFSIDSLNRHVVYRSVVCNHQAGYICKKKSVDLSEVQNMTITNITSGSLDSPNHPGLYLNNLNYHVNITAVGRFSIIVIWFDMIEIEWQSECLYDYLEITEHGAGRERICGLIDNPDHLSNLTYFSRLPRITISFHSDYSNRGAGFKLNWRIVDPAWCSRPITISSINQTGFIESPGYPEWSLPSMNCSYVLVAPKDTLILLTLIDFNLGSAKRNLRDNRCRSRLTSNSEYLTLELDDHRNITLCGSIENKDLLTGQQFLSYGHSLTLVYRTKRRKFHSPFQNFRGFKFKYQIILRSQTVLSVLTLQENTFGRLTSMNYPHKAPSNLNYTIYLRTEVGHRIELKSSRSSQMVITAKRCSNYNYFKDYFISITDAFGSLDLNPPTPVTWFLCQSNHRSNGYQNGVSVIGTSRPSETITSRFHSLKISIVNLNPGKQETEAGHTFQLIYKTETDPILLNKTKFLARDYPVDSCAYNPCSDKGVCVDRTIGSSSISLCQCTAYWTGLFCHLTLCDLNVCSGNGLCKINTETSDYVCHCNRGFTGRNCRDTVSTCDRTNPCGDSGKCSLINGNPVCECPPWLEGRFCDKFRLHIHYKPLSQRMLEEPFWLGLITVAVVLALISLVYCLKKKFAEKIEKFFEEEIEKSKTLTAFGLNDIAPGGHRYSLTSNLGVSVNVTPVNRSPPLPRSRSSIIGRICKRGLRTSNAGHLSDSEVVHRKEKDDGYSDTELPTSVGGCHGGSRRKFAPLLFFSSKSMGASSSGLVSSFERDEKSRILSSLVSGGLKSKERRMSLDDFIQFSQSKIRSKKAALFTSRDYGQSLGNQDSSSDAEQKHSPVQSRRTYDVSTMPSTSNRQAVSIRALSRLQFHAIRENSQEDQEYHETCMSDEYNPKLDSIIEVEQTKRLEKLMTQDSEVEGMLSNIETIQNISRSCLGLDRDNDNVSSGSGSGGCGNGNGTGFPRPRSSFRLKRSPSPRRPPSDLSSSSDSGSPNHITVPEIMVTRASVEYQDISDSELPPIPSLGRVSPSLVPTFEIRIDSPESSEGGSSGREGTGDFDNGIGYESHRRISYTGNNNYRQGSLEDRPGEESSKVIMTSLSSPANEAFSVRRLSEPPNLPPSENRGDQTSGPDLSRHSHESAIRKYSLELSVPQITINMEEGGGVGVGQGSHCNLSPGISRTNSSSPILDEIGGINTNLSSVFIPESIELTVGGNGENIRLGSGSNVQGHFKKSSNFGNFLTIPTVSYPPRNNQNSTIKRRIMRSRENLRCIGENSGPSSPRKSSSPEPGSGSSQYIEIIHGGSEREADSGSESSDIRSSIGAKRERLLAMKQLHKTIGVTRESIGFAGKSRSMARRSANRSLDEYGYEDDGSFVFAVTTATESAKSVQRPRSPMMVRPKPAIQRNPSWPGLIKSIVTSSDSDDNAIDIVTVDDYSLRESRSPSRRPTRRLSSKRSLYHSSSKSSQSLCEPGVSQQASYSSGKSSVGRVGSGGSGGSGASSSGRRPMSRTDSYPMRHYYYDTHSQQARHHDNSSSSSESYLSNDDELITMHSTRSLNAYNPNPSPRGVKSVSPRGSLRRLDSEACHRYHEKCSSVQSWTKPFRAANLREESRKMSISDTALSFDAIRSGRSHGRSWYDRRSKMKSPSQSLPTEGSEDIEIIIPARSKRKAYKILSPQIINPNCGPNQGDSSDETWSESTVLVRQSRKPDCYKEK